MDEIFEQLMNERNEKLHSRIQEKIDEGGLPQNWWSGRMTNNHSMQTKELDRKKGPTNFELTKRTSGQPDLEEHHEEYPDELLKQTIGDFLEATKDKDERLYHAFEKIIDIFLDKGNVKEAYPENDKDFSFDYQDIGQFSMPDSKWKNFNDKQFEKIGKAIVNKKFKGNLKKAYDTVVHKNRKENVRESINESMAKVYTYPTQKGKLQLSIEEDAAGVMVDIIFNTIDLTTTDIAFPTGEVTMSKWKKKVKLKESVNEALSTEKVDVKPIIAKMKKEPNLFSGFIKDVKKMGTVSRQDLEDLFPDWIPGWEISKLFK